MEKSKTLLKKYGIPLSHLDFQYVAKCENAREMEKIVTILRSGEEGYFPDLLRCSEEKLKQLKPESKLFRFEEKIRQSNSLDKEELKPIYDWTTNIKNKDNALAELKQEEAEPISDLPPVRESSKIEIDKEESEKKDSRPASKPSDKPQPRAKNEQRIKSTDYSKWDKYNPDEEILRMDLDEERSQEKAKIKLDKIERSTNQEQIKITEQAAEEQRLQAQLQKLSVLEREQYGEKYRLRGNEYFKAKEYENAIKEYTLAIIYDPENAARPYNNRAISFLKLKKYLPAIDDCEACLRLEPDNIKALLRLADANYGQGRRRESYGLYQRVLELEPHNVCAKNSLEQIREQLGELAPAHATRLTIEELKEPAAEQKPKAQAPSKPQPKPQSKPQPKPAAVVKPIKDYDLAELVKPNRVVKSKIASAAEALGGTLKGTNSVANAQKQQLQQMMQQVSEGAQGQMRLPQCNNRGNNKKLLIQEM